jgi:hypothetical protein
VSLPQQLVSVFRRENDVERHGEVGEERRVRPLQPNSDGALVGRFDRFEKVAHAEIVEVIVPRVRDAVVGMVGLPLPQQREQHVIRMERTGRLEAGTRMELDALPEPKGVFAAIGRDRPRLG